MSSKNINGLARDSSIGGKPQRINKQDGEASFAAQRGGKPQKPLQHTRQADEVPLQHTGQAALVRKKKDAASG